jgi:hypothetical protein
MGGRTMAEDCVLPGSVAIVSMDDDDDPAVADDPMSVVTVVSMKSRLVASSLDVSSEFFS